MGATAILTIIFVVLKLIGTINWSWWLVLLPELIVLPFYIGYVAASFVAFRYVRKITRQAENEFSQRR